VDGRVKPGMTTTARPNLVARRLWSEPFGAGNKNRENNPMHSSEGSVRIELFRNFCFYEYCLTRRAKQGQDAMVAASVTRSALAADGMIGATFHSRVVCGHSQHLLRE
jgi:hypothetical protein